MGMSTSSEQTTQRATSWPVSGRHAAGLRRPDPLADSAQRGPHAPDRLQSYRAVGVAYTAVMSAGLLLSHRRRADPERAPSAQWSDVALVALSTFKISRLVSKQTVAAPLRAPFTRDEGAAGPGERNARPVGTGLRRSMGELLSCPFCLDVWVATGATLGLRIAPGVARPVLSTFAAVAGADMLQFVYVDLEHRAES
jgi:hypothetical protein